MARRKEKWNQPAPVAKELSKGKKIGIAFAVILALLAVLAVAAVLLDLVPWPLFGANDPSPTEPVLEEAENTVIHFVAGGDVNVTDKVVLSGATGTGYDYDAIFMDIIPALAGGDLTVLNLEGNLYGEKYGSKTILVCRLLPFVSFDAVSYFAGLTPIKFWPFFIATGLGQLPATIVYSYVGGMLSGGARWLVTGLLCLFGLAIFTTILKQMYDAHQAKKQAK